MSTQPKVPYTKRHSLTEGPLLNDYCSGSQKIRELHTSLDMTAMVAVVGPNRCLTIHVSILLENLGGTVTTILMNNSNTELAAAMASPVILAIFPLLASHHNIPLFSVKDWNLQLPTLRTQASPIFTHTLVGYLECIHWGRKKPGWKGTFWK
jgi:hypothetical protein